MRTIGQGKDTYLYLNGISTSKEILLHRNVVLIPVTARFQYKKVSDLLHNDIDFAVAAVSGRSIASQLHLTAENGNDLAALAWNASWHCLLLGAIFHCEVFDNLQCDKPIENLEESSYINVTNYAFRAILTEPYKITQDDETWIIKNYSSAYELLDKEPFMTAVHAMATYKWHSMPRVQLAILWSGIEALFEASTEISFRISLYIANYLSNSDLSAAEEIFLQTKKLYASRSAAVHGGKMKGDLNEIVSESAKLLNHIIRRCAELGRIPDTSKLIFPSLYDGAAEQ